MLDDLRLPHKHKLVPFVLLKSWVRLKFLVSSIPSQLKSDKVGNGWLLPLDWLNIVARVVSVVAEGVCDVLACHPLQEMEKVTL